jgi:glycosyltransferase involved in cell wall biosynthesis
MTITQELQGMESSAGERNLQKSQELKVAYIMSRFPKLTETFILYEMLAMRQQGIQVEVYPLIREREERMHPEAAQFVEIAHFQPFISLPIVRANLYFLWKKPFIYLKTLWDLLRANWGSFNFLTGVIGLFPKTVLFAFQMRADKVQHIHAHFASHPAAAAFIIHRLVGIPYSFTAHGSDLHRDRHMLREKVAEAAFVAAISEYNKELMISECRGHYSEKIQVVHCGVDTEVFRARSHRTPYEKGENPFMILCIGTLHEVKGQAYLIDACHQLRGRGFNFECHFVGDGPDRKALTDLVDRAGLSDKVRFQGRLTRDEIARLLLDADVLAAPSVPTRDGRREGIPVVLMEAMGSGVPVIASNLSGIPELVNNQLTGLLVPPRDATSLANGLERYIKDPNLRRRLGRAGREKVVEAFDLNKNAAGLAQHFLEGHQ